ncbi:MAG: type III pantothenate kinase [Clostridia bacterium]|nr:type III pantothenate kinase [Clostridia bacterium]
MLLAIDVGNTNIVLGVYENDKMIAHFRLATLHDRSRDEYGILFTSFLEHRNIKISDIDDVIIASVVPQVMYSLERAIKDYLNNTPIIVNHKTPLGIDIKIDNPRELGADRLVNAYGVNVLYGAPAIVVDFGTATTFCAIDRNGDYLGGAICPGVKISLEALFMKTAKLPRVEIAKPESVIGKNTVESMQSGVLYGYVGQVLDITRRMREEMGEPDAKIIGTGGLASLISSETDLFYEINGNLTLESLRLIYNNIFKKAEKA